MMKKRRKLAALMACIFLGSCMFTGCGAGSNDMKTESMNEMVSDSFAGTGDLLDYESSMSENNGDSSNLAEGDTSSSVSTNRKIIEKVYLNAETKEFDALLDKLEEEIEKIGGYVENSSISGNSYR